jgi:uncharacterized protein (TIGR02118 family)
MYRISAIYNAEAGKHFDREYYLDVHVPLAFRQLKGRVNIKKFEVEWDLEQIDWTAQSGLEKKNIMAPCRFSAIVETERDLQDFFKFMKTPDRDPLHEDVKKYTDCSMTWVISELLEPPG